MTASPDNPATDRLGRLVRLTIGRFGRDGNRALEAACAERPELEAPLRRMVGHLVRTGLLSDPAASGVRIPGYTVLDRLGAGGMGQVFLARDSLNRLVALKLLQPSLLGSARSRARFEREVRTLAELDHPGICTVYEARTDAEPPYLAMRFLPGGSLEQLLDEQRRKLLSEGGPTAKATGAAVQLVAKVARALDAAHELGIVHRDVKPGNVMLDAADEPVLVDFGLARREDDSTPSLTVTGALLGTPTYMAPEQIEARSEPIDRRVDVYALGVVLYELLTLEPPFMATSRESLYRQILSGSWRDPRHRNRHAPDELSVVLRKAMARDPRDRFPTTAELAEELERIDRRETIRTIRPSASHRLLRWTQRNPTAAAALAFVSFALLLSVGLLIRNDVLSEARATATRELRAKALASVSRLLEREDPILSLKIARAALRVSTDPDVVDQAQSALSLPRERWRAHVGGSRERLIFSPDGTRIAVGAGRGQAVILLDAGGRKIAEIDTQGLAQAIEFRPDSELLAVPAYRGIRLFDRKGHATEYLPHLGDDRWFRSIRFDPSGLRVVAGGSGGDLAMWRTDGSCQAVLQDAHGNQRVSAIEFRPSGDRLASVSAGRSALQPHEHCAYSLCLWTPQLRRIRRVPAHRAAITNSR